MSVDAARQPSIPDSRRGDLEPPPHLRAGWAPGHDETSLEAVDYRARQALQDTHAHEQEIGALKVGLTEVASALRSVVRVLKGLGVLALPGVISVIVDAFKAAAHWLSTLHH